MTLTLALVFTLYTAAALVAMHVIQRDVDPLLQPISAYALGRGGFFFSIALTAWGASGWLLAAALANRGPRLAQSLLWVFGAGLMIAAVFPMDVPFPPTSWTIRALSWRGIVHIIGASLSSLSFPVAALILAPSFPDARFLRTIAVASALAVAAVFLLPFVDVRWFGFAQRAMAANVLAWLVLVELSLMRR